MEEGREHSERERYRRKLYEEASIRLPNWPRRPTDFYIAILHHEKSYKGCSWGDFYWLKVKGKCTVGKLQTFCTKIAGRKIILHDGGVIPEAECKVWELPHFESRLIVLGSKSEWNPGRLRLGEGTISEWSRKRIRIEKMGGLESQSSPEQDKVKKEEGGESPKRIPHVSHNTQERGFRSARDLLRDSRAMESKNKGCTEYAGSNNYLSTPHGKENLGFIDLASGGESGPSTSNTLPLAEVCSNSQRRRKLPWNTKTTTDTRSVKRKLDLDPEGLRRKFWASARR